MFRYTEITLILEYNLTRFVQAQLDTYSGACDELRAGRKRGHWMWFIFPQIQGLGLSPRSIHFGISSTAEAHAYLKHPILGERLRHVVSLVTSIKGKSLFEIFGSPDDLKFCSSMTLFARVSGGNSIFCSAIEQFCGGRLDEKTLAILATELAGRSSEREENPSEGN